MNICKSYLPKGLLIIFFIQFLVFLFISIKSSDQTMIYWSTGVLFLGLILSSLKLTVKSTNEKIEYKFWILKTKIINRSDIDNIEFLKVSNFTGYGISFSKKYGLAYIMNTKEAICITKNNGKKITLSICESSSMENNKH